MVLTRFCLDAVFSSLILGGSAVRRGNLCIFVALEHRLTSDTAHCHAIYIEWNHQKQTIKFTSI